jgi:hypothetical protein
LNKFRLAAVAGAAALAISGCGGGDSSSSNKTLSYADTGTQLNSICNEFNPKLDALGNQLKGDPANDAPIWDQAVTATEDGVAKIKELDVPSELKADYDTFVSSADQQLALLKTGAETAKAGDEQQYKTTLKGFAKQAKPIEQQSDLAASKLGASDCLDDNNS